MGLFGELRLWAHDKDVVGKVAPFLSEPIDSEYKVVYFLAEVRKLLERDDPDQKMGSLWMYCHWALLWISTNRADRRRHSIYEWQEDHAFSR